MTTVAKGEVGRRGSGREGRLGKVGRQAALGGVLVGAGVELEWVLDFQTDDGTVTRPAAFGACVVLSAVGFALLALAARGLRTTGRSRTLRVGSALTSGGAWLLVLFSAAVLVTGLATGSPTELSFVAFGLGMLLLSVGLVVLGLGLRRTVSRWAWLLVAAGVATFAAIAIPLDPWHDVALGAMCAAWSAFGLLVRRS